MSKGNLVVLLLLLAIGSWAWWHNQQQPQIQTQDTVTHAPKLEYFADDFSVTTMTPEGKPARTLIAKRMEHFSDTGITQLQQPFLRIYNQPASTWEVISQEGQLSADGTSLLLSGKVEIDRPASPGVTAMHISTSNLRVKVDQDYAETDEAAKITSEAGWVQGVGMQAWLREPSHINFLSQTRAYYEAQ